MTTFTLQRLKQTSSATFGEILDPDGRHVCFTLERPWLNNQHAVSCIPAGSYPVARRDSVKHHGQVWGLSNVPGRSDIEIHPANLAAELEGCIAPGTEFGEVSTAQHGDGYGIRHSKDALATLDHVIGDTPEWTLAVLDPNPS